jgi:HAD superfamily hydrolase (TIGR01549 family)
MTRYLLAICLDFGDTLADEATEVKDGDNTTLTADLIPGAAELLRALKQRGYPLALVADGRPGTYTNVLSQHSLLHLFVCLVVSEIVGVEKPDGRMFAEALACLGLEPADGPRVLMVGNNLERDVKGANLAGWRSVWIDWAPRRAKIPADELERPRHTIRLPLELLDVVDALEQAHASGAEAAASLETP